MIEQAFYKLLSQTTSVASLVNDRVYFVTRPQSERRPSIILTRVNTQLFRTFRTSSGSIKGSLQVDCLAPTYRDAKQLAKTVRNVLDNYSGIVGTTRMRWCQIDDESDIPTEPLEGQAEPTFGVTLECRWMADEGN